MKKHWQKLSLREKLTLGAGAVAITLVFGWWSAIVAFISDL